MVFNNYIKILSCCSVQNHFHSLLFLGLMLPGVILWSLAILPSVLYLQLVYTAHTKQKDSFNTPTCRSGNFLCTVITLRFKKALQETWFTVVWTLSVAGLSMNNCCELTHSLQHTAHKQRVTLCANTAKIPTTPNHVQFTLTSIIQASANSKQLLSLIPFMTVTSDDYRRTISVTVFLYLYFFFIIFMSFLVLVRKSVLSVWPVLLSESNGESQHLGLRNHQIRIAIFYCTCL